MKFFSKDNSIFYFLIVVFIVLIYFIINIFSYFDITSLCYISTERDVIRGNEETIKQALKLIKKGNKNDYKMICKYVNTISEKYCTVADWHINEGEVRAGYEEAGCYVRGSKTIYIQPTQEETDEVIKARAEDIIKYASFSKEFWQNY